MSATLPLADDPGVEVSPATLDFELPDRLVAAEPPEARGLARDEVRMMVSLVADDRIAHARFRDLPRFLAPGDVLVVNASATIPAAVDARRPAGGGAGGEPGEGIVVHFSTPLPDGRWAIELRRRSGAATVPFFSARSGERLALAGGGRATLVEPLGAARTERMALPGGDTGRVAPDDRVRLWVADVALPGAALDYLATYGAPIRYDYVRARWPLSFYQTIFATEPGSAEMPSAGRAFTRDVVARLTRKCVRIVPLVLHTGVASLESDEAPYPERFRVPVASAEAINRARAAGGRIVAVGTTVVRALETVATPDGRVRAGSGWTDLVITPERGVHAVDGLLTGLHGPRASHLSMLEAVADRRHLALAYEAALAEGYLWHEFGDLHLMFGAGQ